MIKSITIENFMSHLATKIELAPGVTVITGPNNVGKSSTYSSDSSLAFVETIISAHNTKWWIGMNKAQPIEYCHNVNRPKVFG